MYCDNGRAWSPIAHNRSELKAMTASTFASCTTRKQEAMRNTTITKGIEITKLDPTPVGFKYVQMDFDGRDTFIRVYLQHENYQTYGSKDYVDTVAHLTRKQIENIVSELYKKLS